jgi:ABC-type antimicrobial peptide transport system permease subunit
MLYFALRELTNRKKLYLLNVVTISLVTFMLIVLTCLAAAYKNASKLPFQDVQGSIIIQKNGNVPENISGVLLSCSLAPISVEAIPKITKIYGVRDVATALSLWVFDADYFKRVLGVNWNDDFGRKLASRLIEGSVPTTDGEVVAEKTYAQKYNLGPGSKTTVSGRNFIVTGIMRASGNEIAASDLIVNLRVAQDMAYRSKNLQAVETFNRTDVNIILVNAVQTRITEVSQEIKGALSDPSANSGETPLGQIVGTYNIYTPRSFEDQISAVFRISDKLMWIIALVIFAGDALIIARNTLHIVLERRKEFGIMKSVGFRRKDLQKETGVETIIQILNGFAAGLALSALAIFILGHTTVSIAIPWELSAYPHFLLANPNDANVVQTYLLPISLEPLYAGATFLLVLLIGLMTSFLSMWQISKLRPMEVLKHE